MCSSSGSWRVTAMGCSLICRILRFRVRWSVLRAMSVQTAAPYSTVSQQLIEDWLVALRSLCRADQYTSLLRRSGLPLDGDAPKGRVTLDQIVCLYRIAAVETCDEMMGLWSRPIRPRALQHLLTSVREATSLSSALYRFSRFWNLLLDDYQFDLVRAEGTLTLGLLPLGKGPSQR
ncbi:AraC family transcriptional regulator ligand-binding domain-containing protein [Tateyamaria omphalii]|uniref:AraC family transcriptional regulator ligand-binding domain-containing protein n=1 Tax=Tateyamaria omphalii TaxID=299262 RepID=UPI003F691092